MIARWSDTLEEASEHKRLKEKLKQSKQEMISANKALIKVYMYAYNYFNYLLLFKFIKY